MKTGQTKKLLKLLNANPCCDCPPISDEEGNIIQCNEDGLFASASEPESLRFAAPGEDDSQDAILRQFFMNGNLLQRREFSIHADTTASYTSLTFGLFDNAADGGPLDIFMMALNPYAYTGYVLFDMYAGHGATAGQNRFELFASDDVNFGGIYGHDNGDLVLRSTTQRISIQHGLAEYADDAAAAVGGIDIGEVYRTGSFVKIRVA